LVVDDDPAICSLLEDLLTEERYRARSVRSGEDALAALAQERPDLVLVDVELPTRGGLELARDLRAQGVPVVVISAFYGAIDLPGVPFVPKPFDLPLRLGTVAAVLGTSAG
jgi:DNA-binding response OmpR family regulator